MFRQFMYNLSTFAEPVATLNMPCSLIVEARAFPSIDASACVCAVCKLQTLGAFGSGSGGHNIGPSPTGMASNSYRYSRLTEADEAGTSTGAPDSFVANVLQKQEQIIREQDEDLELVGKSVSTLKDMSSRIGVELEQQSVMLDDLGVGMDRVDTKLDNVMKKIARLSNMEDDATQWKAIIILTVVLFVLILLLIVL